MTSDVCTRTIVTDVRKCMCTHMHVRMRVRICTQKHNHIEKNRVPDKDISSWQLNNESVGLTSGSM